MEKKTPERLWDWTGLVVRSRYGLSNGLVRFPAGTYFRVVSTEEFLNLNSKPCDCCHVSAGIFGVPTNSVEIIDVKENWDRLRWNEDESVEGDPPFVSFSVIN